MYLEACLFEEHIEIQDGGSNDFILRRVTS